MKRTRAPGREPGLAWLEMARISTRKQTVMGPPTVGPKTEEDVDRLGYRTPAELFSALIEQFGQALTGGRVPPLLEEFGKLSEASQRQSLGRLYLALESELTGRSDNGTTTRGDLREWVERNAPELIRSDSALQLVFSPEQEQQWRLCRLFLESVLRESLAKAEHDQRQVLEGVLAWLKRVPDEVTWPAPLALTDPLPDSDEGWNALLGKLSRSLYGSLREWIGGAETSQIYTEVMEVLAQDYGSLTAFTAVMAQLPDEQVSPTRLQRLNREQLERLVLSKAKDLLRLYQVLDEQSEELERARRELRRARALSSEAVREFQSVLDTVGEAIMTTDAAGTIVMANREAERIWGCRDDQLFGMPLRSLLADRGESWDNLAELVGRRIELDGVRRDGTSFPLTLQISQTPSGELVLFTVVARDLSEQRRFEDALRARHERYVLAVEGANHGLWDWNLISNECHFSEQWKRMLGLSEDGTTDTPETWFQRIHADDAERVQSDLRAHLEGRTTYFENEHRIRHADGTYRWMLSRGRAVFDGSGRAIRIAGSQVDLTERKVTDALTGLPNRVFFMDRLGRSIERCRREPGYLFAVLFVDLDGFKVVNDSLGHLMGDQLLLAIAQRLEACVRAKDMVARMGGDEFTILLEQIADVGDAKRVADRIHKELTTPFYLRRQQVFTSASIGIALGTADYEGAEDLLRDADTAMYRAKATGKARYKVFDPAMRDRAVALMELHTDLRRAVERSEFELHYQPIVSATSDRTEAFEALARWRHSERGMVSPADFIPLAEETGLIIPIGRWVLREACRQLRHWQDQAERLRDISVSVNLSRREFARRDLARQIEQVLSETGVRPSLLKLEITESMIMADEDYAVEQLTRLRQLDIQICIDDFGTGYSSLSALHRFPINMLKIDRSFVGSMEVDPENVEIVRTIIILAHNLNMEVVAEGVERLEQLELLRSLGCDYWQGFYYTKPVPGDRAVEFVGPAPQALLRPKGKEDGKRR